jgi:hypothetical protein
MGRANAWKPGPRLYHATITSSRKSYLWAEAIAPLRATFDAVLATPAVVHLSFVDSQTEAGIPCLRRWCWCDALFMSPPTWVALSRQTGDARYADFALREFWATTDFLYDPAEKLYFRDSHFFERRDDQTQTFLEPQQWLGLRRHCQPARCATAGRAHRPRGSPVSRDGAKLRSIRSPWIWAPSLLGPTLRPDQRHPSMSTALPGV